MTDEPDIPKLRLAPPETQEDLARRFEREQRAVQLQREEQISHSLAPFRVGSVPYLNAVPLTRGIEDQVVFLPPSQLAERLRQGELDAALVSIVEVLLQDRYDILDGIAIASLGEVKSVLLAHSRPLEQLDVVYCDTASLTSIQLLRVLLAERGLHPAFQPLAELTPGKLPDALLLIGDQALQFVLGPHDHEVLDLGAAWFETTGLPFVYAVWALRRGIENQQLRRRLHEVRSFGLETLDAIIAERTEFTADFRRDYLGWHVHFHLGSDERRGIARFMDLLRKHGIGPVYEPRFVR